MSRTNRSTAHTAGGNGVGVLTRVAVAVAVLAGTLATVMVAAAPPAAADHCIESCGQVEFKATWAEPETPIYGERTLLRTGVRDESASCNYFRICDDPRGHINWYDGDSTTAFARSRLQKVTRSSAETYTYYAGLTAGHHRIRMELETDEAWEPATGWLEVTVVPDTPVAAAVRRSSPESLSGQPVELSTSVQSARATLGPGVHQPTGYVQFWDGGTLLGTDRLELSGGVPVARLTVPLRGGGYSHSLFVRYLGDVNYESVFSSPVAHKVNKGSSTTSLGQSSTSSVFGQPVTLTAYPAPVAPSTATPTGTVTFADTAAGALGSAATGRNVFEGKRYRATFTTSDLPVGNRKLTATYGGNGDLKPSTSPVITHTVTKAATTTNLVTSPNPSNKGQQVTMTATVAVVAPGAGAPGGWIQFLDGSEKIGDPVRVTNGSAILTTSALRQGTHNLKAKYLGDASFTASTSAVRSHVVR